jgi:hypothetical protein
MKLKCFGCAQWVQADDAPAVASAFVAHGREKHTLSYPEQAVLNYALNYAEAVARLTGGTQRLSEMGELTVHAVTADRVDDWLRFLITTVLPTTRLGLVLLLGAACANNTRTTRAPQARGSGSRDRESACRAL